MESTAASLERVRLLLDALVIDFGALPPGSIGNAAFQWVVEWLRLDPRSALGSSRIAHLVATQLAPRAAIDYTAATPTARWRIVAEYLDERFAVHSEECEQIARLIAATLDAADARRRQEHVRATESVERCAICRLSFRHESASVQSRDPFKPIWLAEEELTRPELDHIVPISGLGRHTSSNFQVICRACNQAKGDGLELDPGAEIRYAGVPLADVPRIHLFRMLQWLIVAHGGECAVCGSGDGELTMRPVHDDAPLARATMQLRCYECA